MWKRRKQSNAPLRIEDYGEMIVRNYKYGRDIARPYASLLAQRLEPYTSRASALIGREAYIDVLIDSALRFAKRTRLDWNLNSEIEITVREYCEGNNIDDHALKYPTSDAGGTYSETGYRSWKRNDDTSQPELKAVRKITREERRREKQAGKEH